ncbi:MAG: glycine--tRNA ligase subunit beta [Desulfobulbaceae bacterium A2]|nr:MAG: glycine--tRNA ligase subunit beta [Desulfobulbaceae bacterium A2]
MAHRGELLFEIGTEEIPAGFILPATEFMASWLRERLASCQLACERIETAATPRRLAVALLGLAARQPDRREEVVGPPCKAGFAADGKPTKAALGFAASQGVPVEDLRVINTPKGEYLALTRDIPGRGAAELLVEILAELPALIPFPKSMRWGTGSLAFARPIRWLLALLDGQVLPMQLAGLDAGDLTRGHRFLAPEEVRVGGYADYLRVLRERQVLVLPAERRQAVWAEVERAVRDQAGLPGAVPLRDEALLDLVSNLVEQPSGVCGRFDERYLEVPAEVLVTSMREHQKYFPVADAQGRLLPRFVAVNNTRIENPALAAAGHERVLRARLEDAFFFFREDRKQTLAQRAEQLSGIVFQQKLGTMADKSGRMVELARWLAGQLAPAMTPVVERAAALAKADLLTAMVGEFPTLQGVMGREYALRDGEPAAVAQAIREHYLPARADDLLPESVAGTLVGLADRLDTLAGCFALGQRPSGTADPFGLRRLAIAVLRLIEGAGLALSLSAAIARALGHYQTIVQFAPQTAADLLLFLRRRYENDLVGRGFAIETVEAAMAAGFDDLLDTRARVAALDAMRQEGDFAVLAASFKRIRNIVKDNQDHEVDPALFVKHEESGLYHALLAVQRTLAPLLVARDYPTALRTLLPMKEPLDRFFDAVLVMDEDPLLRRNRLNLLTALGAMVLRLGDISRMQV